MKLFLSLILLSSHQIIPSFSSSKDHWYCEEQKYTYQLEVYNSRSQIQVQADFCDYLSQNRDISEDRYIQLYPNVRLIIFSQNKIDQGLAAIPQILYKN